MPHECTNCGKRFADGSKAMLGGCPQCEGKKFKFVPKGGMQTAEADAQSTARSEMVSLDRLSSGDTTTQAPPEPAKQQATESEDTPTDLEELRERLDDQFESIKIVEPGQYELNLMELYDRDTYVISLQEDGRYVIDVPEAWRASTTDDGD